MTNKLMQYKLFSYFILCFSFSAFANNSTYISLSNNVARMQELEVITNNAANTNTIGYESDSILFKKKDSKENGKKSNSYVESHSLYKSEMPGGLKSTQRPLDIAIIGDNNYFKVLTPKGIRLTLAGSMFINSNFMLVNSEGYPFLGSNEDIIEIPEGYKVISITGDGTIVIDNEQTAIIGVFAVENKNTLIKEGDSLYRNTAEDNPAENYTVVSGALRASNVNNAKIMSQMIEAERSVLSSNKLMNDINELEKLAVSKILK